MSSRGRKVVRTTTTKSTTTYNARSQPSTTRTTNIKVVETISNRSRTKK